MAPERDRLRRGGLSDKVIQTIQAARAGSTTACYRTKWLGVLQLLELVQLGDWFTTIDLKDADFHVEIASFAFQGIAYECNYRLATPCPHARSANVWPQRFSRFATMAWGFYFIDLIVMARSRELVNVPHSPIDLTPNQVGGLRSIGRRAVPYLSGSQMGVRGPLGVRWSTAGGT